jgi:hypothetical protein
MSKFREKRWELIARFCKTIQSTVERSNAIMFYDSQNMEDFSFIVDEDNMQVYFLGVYGKTTYMVYDEDENDDDGTASVFIREIKSRVKAYKQIQF